KNEIYMGLDISTTCIGVCILENDGSENGKVLELTHVSPKIPKKIKGIESLFIKKQIFKNEFLSKWKNFGINKVIIESPLLSSNNINTVAVLLQFNGMISDCIYETLGIVPEYITSYDARKYAFPELITVRKYNKKNVMYPKNKLLSAIKNNNTVLFGSYMFDCSKKEIIWNKITENFTDINWLYDDKDQLKKENFDASDALTATIGYLHKQKYGELNITTKLVEEQENKIIYEISYWNKTEIKEINLT
ncbi:MAG: hypothetical protein IKT40_07545, partial [Bacilli bacterium]|nr:hypothetical protein [Bacilli bacterium]